jgi:hypothetical protein
MQRGDREFFQLMLLPSIRLFFGDGETTLASLALLLA